jgi:hypothetical protein
MYVELRLGEFLSFAALLTGFDNLHATVDHSFLTRRAAKPEPNTRLADRYREHLSHGVDPRTSVIDRICRTYLHPNLFLLGSRDFQASGTANPT